jgi:hypothetical protein
MENENNVLAEDSNTVEESTDLNPVEEQVDSPETTESEEVDWKAEAEKAKADYQAQKIRAEKAEKKAKEPKVEPKVEPTNPGISSKDTIALINAKVHEDDVDEVIEYSKFKKISIAEALKSGVIKASLSEKEELRNTANATNTGKTRSGSSKVSGENLLDKARKTGEVPDSEEALDAMLTERYKR